MNFEDITNIKEAGFTGFIRMQELFLDSKNLPRKMGVYLILNLNGSSPEFLTIGTGGHFKEKNPNVSISVLKSNWVNDTIVVYIGKAGKVGGSVTLRSRLRQYFRFGQGSNVGHWGGRFIWQLKNSSDLLVCWKELSTEDPRTVEAILIKEFYSIYNQKPFANLTN